MALTTHVHTNFTAGEISPRLFGRSDISKYANAAAELENFLVQPQGGLIRRSGTRFVKETKESDRFSRLISFRFSVQQSYILEFGHQYLRVYRNRAQLCSGGIAIEFVSPYIENQLKAVKFTQSADILFLAHPDVKPQELQRLEDTDWKFVDFDFTDGPYLDVNTTDTTLTPSATTGTDKTITASDVIGINNDQGFLPTDVDRLIRIKIAAIQGYAKIITFTDDKNVQVDIIEDFGGTTASKDWRLGAWSDTTGWPFAMTFHQGRLWFGGTNTQPQTLWGSVVGDFTNFQPTQTDSSVRDDDGVTFTIDDDSVNTIRWLISGPRGMVLGTDGGEFVMQSRGPFDPITPTDIAIRRQSTYGAEDGPRPFQASSALLFVQRFGRKVREFAFSFDLDQFVAPDMTLLAEHITTSRIVDTSYMQTPEPILWSVLSGGELLAMTYMREQDVVAWHRHVLGGSFGSGAAVVESIAVIPDDPSDQLWMIVKRTIEGVTRRYVEFMEDRFELGSNVADAFYVDSGLSLDSPTDVTVISNLDHLEGESVAVMGDGAPQPNQTVVGGKITLDEKAKKVHVGLQMTAQITTAPMVPRRAPTDPRGKHKLQYKMFILFHESVGGTVNTIIDRDKAATEEPLIFRTGLDSFDTALGLFTGTKEVSLPSGHGRDIQLRVSQKQPLPMTILSIISEVDIGGV